MNEFKVWNRKEKKFDDYNKFAICNDGKLIKIDSTLITGYVDENNYIVCKKTSLVDKNKKYIYEGDILIENRICKETLIKYYIAEKSNNCGISFDGFHLKSLHYYPANGSKFSYHIPLDCEIIGNIYSDEDLLESIFNTGENVNKELDIFNDIKNKNYVKENKIKEIVEILDKTSLFLKNRENEPLGLRLEKIIKFKEKISDILADI